MKFNADSPAECIKTCCVQLPGFDIAIRELGAWHIVRDGELIGQQELHLRKQFSELCIVPVIEGSDAAKMILGGILLFAASFIPVLTPFVAKAIAGVGLSLAMGGVAQLLAPQPKMDRLPNENLDDLTFNNLINLYEEGYPIPIVYGEVIVGSIVVRNQLLSENIKGLGSGFYEGGYRPVDFKDVVSSANANKSKAVFRSLHLISHGEIEGLATGNTVPEGDASIFLNGTPLGDGKDKNSRNFAGVTWHIRTGKADQPIIPGFGNPAGEVPVNQSLNPGEEQPITIDDRSITEIAFNILISTLYQRRGNDLVDHTLSLEITTNSGITKYSWVGRVFGGRVIKTVNVPIVWDDSTKSLTLTIKNTSSPNSDSNTMQAVQFNSYTRMSDIKLPYNGYALVALEFDAQNFGNSLPEVKFLVKGKKIRVPSNYNAITRDYKGMWDGQFKEEPEWTNNTAWVLYDLLTNKRYGHGQATAYACIDKNELYAIAQYNDQLVKDGIGGEEARFAFDGAIWQESNVWMLLQRVASNCRTMIYYASAMIGFSQDREAEPVKLVTQANVIDGQFEYMNSPDFKRTNQVKAEYFLHDKAKGIFDMEVETAEDRDDQEKRNIISEAIRAYGCTSASRAHRQARWQLYSQLKNTEIVTYRASLDHADVMPGDIIRISDPLKRSVRLGGRVASIYGTTVVTDEQKDKQWGDMENARIIVQLNNGSLEPRNIVKVCENKIIVDTEFSGAVQANNVYIIIHDKNQDAQYRVVGIEEATFTEYVIKALRYDENKYKQIESNLPLRPPPAQKPDFIDRRPDFLVYKHEVERIDNTVVNHVLFEWRRLDPAVRYEVIYQVDNRGFSDILTASSESISLYNENDGIYDMRVRAVDIIGRKSQWAKFKEPKPEIRKSSQPIKNVNNFYGFRDNLNIYFKWDDLDDPLLKHYVIRRGDSWAGSTLVVKTTANNYTTQTIVGDKYWIKAERQDGKLSNHAIFVEIAEWKENTYRTHEEKKAGWQGEKTNFMVNASGNLQMTDEKAEYITPVIDLGVVINTVVDLDEASSGVKEDYSWKTWEHNTWRDLREATWAGDPHSVVLNHQIRISNDNDNWSDYTEFKPGSYRFKYCQLKTSAELQNSTLIGEITRYTLQFMLPTLREYKQGLIVPIGGIIYKEIKNTYRVVLDVQATIQGGNAGDTVTIHINEMRTEVRIEVFDAKQVSVERTVNLTLEGY